MNDIDIRHTFSVRLKTLLSEHEMTQNQLSKILGVSESTVGKWILEKSLPRMGVIQKLSEYFNVPKSYFLEKRDVPAKTMTKGVRIPVLGNVAAGIPITAITDVEDWEEIPEKMASSGTYFALRIKGQSMEPRIKNGDVVIVRQQFDVDTGDVAIVLVNGDEATVKEVKKLDTGIMLIGWNTAVYSPRFYSAKDIKSLPVKIIGKVVELRGKF